MVARSQIWELMKVHRERMQGGKEIWPKIDMWEACRFQEDRGRGAREKQQRQRRRTRLQQCHVLSKEEGMIKIQIPRAFTIG